MTSAGWRAYARQIEHGEVTHVEADRMRLWMALDVRRARPRAAGRLAAAAWRQAVMQAIKVFVLARVAPRKKRPASDVGLGFGGANFVETQKPEKPVSFDPRDLAHLCFERRAALNASEQILLRVAHETPAVGFRRGRAARAELRRGLEGRLGVLRRDRRALALGATDARRADGVSRRERRRRFGRRPRAQRLRVVLDGPQTCGQIPTTSRTRASSSRAPVSRRVSASCSRCSCSDAADAGPESHRVVRVPPRGGDERTWR